MAMPPLTIPLGNATYQIRHNRSICRRHPLSGGMFSFFRFPICLLRDKPSHCERMIDFTFHACYTFDGKITVTLASIPNIPSICTYSLLYSTVHT